MQQTNLNPTREEFQQMLDANLLGRDKFEDTVCEGVVTALEGDQVIVDVGLKMEGRIPLREFNELDKPAKLSIGDVVTVFVERMESAQGEALISREKAKREQVWRDIESKYEKKERIEGMITGRIKGGFTVDLGGASAFLPGSQVDLRPVRDINPLMDMVQPFLVLKMDRRRGNIVVSRRAVLEEDRSGQREEVVRSLHEGDIKEGIVKNLTAYGAFVELAPGVDGLLHVTDMSWSRTNHPSEVLNVNDKINIKIIKINPESQRISLGLKQLHPDPWEGVATKYAVGAKFKGKVSNVTDYGAFVDLGDGVEGLAHITEMSWIRKNTHPNKIVARGDEVEVMILEVNEGKRRISLGIKQCSENPWEALLRDNLIGQIIEGEIRNITDFGLFVALSEDIDGMVHLSDLSWDRSGEAVIKEYTLGDKIQVKVLDIDPQKERVSLGVKQVEGDPFASVASLRVGSDVTCTVSHVENNGVEVYIGKDEKVKSFIRRSELSRDRSEQRPDLFAVGDRLDARVTAIDRASRKISLSVGAREAAEEKEAVDQYGSAQAGASLGDILGSALQEKQRKSEE